jgi:hypothetical protein
VSPVVFSLGLLVSAAIDTDIPKIRTRRNMTRPRAAREATFAFDHFRTQSRLERKFGRLTVSA